MKFTRKVLCVCLCLILLSGCNTVKLKTFKKSALPHVTLNFCWIGEENPITKAVLKEVADKSNLNIDLNFKWLSTDDYYKNIEDTLTNSATPIDAFIVGGSDDPNGLSYAKLARKGELLDLTTLFPANCSNIIKNLTKDDLDAIKVKGRIYAIPSISPITNSDGIIVREDLMKKYNLSDINSLDDLGVYLADVAKDEKGIVPLTTIPFDTSFYARLYGYAVLDNYTSIVYKYDDPKMKLIPWEDTDAFRDVMTKLTGWIKKGYLMSPQENTLTEAAAYFNSYNYVEKDSTMDFAFNGGSVAVHTYLFGKDLPLIKLNPIATVSDNGGIAISSRSKNAVRTLKFLNWVQGSKDNDNLLVYGRPGKDYTLVNGQMSYPSNEMLYLLWNSSPFKNINYELDKTSVNTLNSRLEYAPSKGFFPDYFQMQDAANARSDTFSKNLYHALYQGSLKGADINTIRAYIKSAAGTDTLITNLQAQLNDFLNSK
ncbi:MAG TPA: extracellular solute-binding protein [Clostridiaceae bacterium]